MEGITRHSGSIQKNAARIAGMFDAIAPQYDLLNNLLSVGMDRRWRDKAVEVLQLAGDETMLDLCTGTADLALTAVRRTEGSLKQVVGIDFAAGMLSLGQAKVRRKGHEDSLHLVRGDASSIPLTTASVDAAAIGFGIRNVEDPAAVCAELRRVLNPGGRLAILEFGFPSLPVLRQVYQWYFTRILPSIGHLISRHPEAYSYLPASVSSFLVPEAFTGLLRRAGFDRIRDLPLSCGIVHLYVAVRP